VTSRQDEGQCVAASSATAGHQGEPRGACRADRALLAGLTLVGVLVSLVPLHYLFGPVSLPAMPAAALR